MYVFLFGVPLGAFQSLGGEEKVVHLIKFPSSSFFPSTYNASFKAVAAGFCLDYTLLTYISWRNRIYFLISLPDSSVKKERILLHSSTRFPPQPVFHGIIISSISVVCERSSKTFFAFLRCSRISANNILYCESSPLNPLPLPSPFSQETGSLWLYPRPTSPPLGS